jgi:S-formylglutathione hydrolase FrmB
MKQFYVLFLLALTLLSFQASAKWFQQKTIYSKALQQEKTYFVGLPTGYSAADNVTKYPVIIFLHGASVTATEMVNTIEPFLDNFLARLFFDKLFKVIFVIPDGACEPYKGSFYTNSALYGNYEDYIAVDMPEEIRSKYHTYSSQEKWSIMGHSMGGYGAMKIALKHPGDFIGVSSLSGPLNTTWFEEMLPIVCAEHGSTPPYNFDYSGSVTKLIYSMAGAFSPSQEATPPILFPINTDGTINQLVLNTWENNNPINLIRKWKGNPAMAVHTYCGELDEFKLAKPNQMFSDTLSKYQLPHTYIQDPSGDHVNSLFTSLPQGINFLYHVMDTAQIRMSTQVPRYAAETNLSVFPNPASERFFVSGDTENLTNISVYNVSGQKLIDKANHMLKKGINISALGNGVYFVTLQFADQKKSTIKFIKQ